jgi:hypothetical protein
MRLTSVAVMMVGCAQLMPIRTPARLLWDDPPSVARTRAELVGLFGPPEAVLASDQGRVLLYRRLTTWDYTPTHFPIARWEEVWFRIQLDQKDRIVGWSRERHFAASD